MTGLAVEDMTAAVTEYSHRISESDEDPDITTVQIIPTTLLKEQSKRIQECVEILKMVKLDSVAASLLQTQLAIDLQILSRRDKQLDLRLYIVGNSSSSSNQI
jgi:hypothetical protein